MSPFAIHGYCFSISCYFFSLLFFFFDYSLYRLHLSFSHSRMISIVCILDMNILSLGLETHDAYAIIIILSSYIADRSQLSTFNCMNDISSINEQFFFRTFFSSRLARQLQSSIFRFNRHHHFTPRHQHIRSSVLFTNLFFISVFVDILIALHLFAQLFRSSFKFFSSPIPFSISWTTSENYKQLVYDCVFDSWVMVIWISCAFLRQLNFHRLSSFRIQHLNQCARTNSGHTAHCQAQRQEKRYQKKRKKKKKTFHLFSILMMTCARANPRLLYVSMTLMPL